MLFHSYNYSCRSRGGAEEEQCDGEIVKKIKTLTVLRRKRNARVVGVDVLLYSFRGNNLLFFVFVGVVMSDASALRCAETTGQDLLYEIQQCEMMSYVVCSAAAAELSSLQLSASKLFGSFFFSVY